MLWYPILTTKAPNGPNDGGLMVLEGSYPLFNQFFDEHQDESPENGYSLKDGFHMSEQHVRTIRIHGTLGSPADDMVLRAWVYMEEGRGGSWGCDPLGFTDGALRVQPDGRPDSTRSV